MTKRKRKRSAKSAAPAEAPTELTISTLETFVLELEELALSMATHVDIMDGFRKNSQ